jgi:hypothetical protein
MVSLLRLAGSGHVSFTPAADALATVDCRIPPEKDAEESQGELRSAVAGKHWEEEGKVSPEVI